MIRHIIVTDDATEISDKTIEVASELAKSLGVHLTLLHVDDPTKDPDIALFKSNEELIEKAKLMNLGEPKENTWDKRAKEKIDNLIEHGLECSSECLIGSPVEKILEFAEDTKADMIVMGSSDRLKGIAKIKALGSVTRKVSEMANCPVLIIH